MSAWVNTWDDSTNSTHRGTLFLIQTRDSTKYATFTTGTVTDNGSYDTVVLTYVAGPGGFTAGEAVAFQFTRTGNAGAGAGDVVGPPVRPTTVLCCLTAATGKLIKTSAAVGALAYLATVGTTEITTNAVTLAKLATQAAGSVLPNNTGGTAVPTAVDIDTTFKTALALVKADVGLEQRRQHRRRRQAGAGGCHDGARLRSVVRVRAVSLDQHHDCNRAQHWRLHRRRHAGDR